MFSLSPYELFNYAEGIVWIIVAVVLPFRFPAESDSQRLGLLISVVGFVAFGVSDFLEAPRQAEIPLWLWGLKVGCGLLLLSGRYTYIGWRNFSTKDRLFRLGLVLLIAVIFLIWLQSYANEQFT